MKMICFSIFIVSAAIRTDYSHNVYDWLLFIVSQRKYESCNVLQLRNISCNLSYNIWRFVSDYLIISGFNDQMLKCLFNNNGIQLMMSICGKLKSKNRKIEGSKYWKFWEKKTIQFIWQTISSESLLLCLYSEQFKSTLALHSHKCNIVQGLSKCYAHKMLNGHCMQQQ